MGKKSSYHGLIVGKVEYFDFKDLLSYPVQRCKLEESPVFKKSIIDYRPDAFSGKEFTAVANEISKRLRKREIYLK